MPNIPKAILYYSESSVWSAVVRLGLLEKGYAQDEVDLKIVDLAKGENFDPTFLRLNPKGTVPILVVPYVDKYTDESQYKALTETKVIVEFLDKSRSALSHTLTTSLAPAPALTPATVAASTTCKVIIEDILHSSEANPNALGYVNARDDASLRDLARATSARLQDRQQTLAGYLAQAEKGEIKVTDRPKTLWKQKLDAVNVILTVIQDAEKAESELDETARAHRTAFFKTAKQTWEINLGGKLVQLSKEMVGPYTLGDQFSIADLHLAGWLTRIVHLCGGEGSDDGKTVVKKIEGQTGVKLPRDFLTRREAAQAEKETKLGAFWDVIRERPSWRKIYGEGLY